MVDLYNNVGFLRVWNERPSGLTTFLDENIIRS